jgi:hypothetical protein
VPDALKVANKEAALGALEGEMGESLCRLVERIASQVFVDPVGVTVVFNVGAFNISLKRQVLLMQSTSALASQASCYDKIEGELFPKQRIELKRERLTQRLTSHILDQVCKPFTIFLERLDDKAVCGGCRASI